MNRQHQAPVAFVRVEIAGEHLAPSEDAEIVNRLYRGQKVEVFEEVEGWARVTGYYKHHFDGNRVARWLKTSSLSPDKPAPPNHSLPDTRLGKALAKSDDVGRYWKRFMRAANVAMERGLVEEDDVVECGGWIRSRSDGYYFVHTESHIRGRIYLHAPSGRMAQWHPRMGDKEIAEYLYEQQNGKCVLCAVGFPLRNLEKDHILPKSKKRIDTISNLQLLCSACNRVKGDRSMEYAVGRLQEIGVIDGERN